MSSQSSSPMVSLTEIEGRGRALVSSQPLKAGDVVLRDSPILLYSSFPLSPPPAAAADQSYCSHCFRGISSHTPSTVAVCSCPWCSTSFFCSSNCRTVALTSSHTPWVCQALKRLRDAFSSSPIDKDRHVQSRFLVAAYNLAVVSPLNFQILLSLQGDHTSSSSGGGGDDTPRFLHSLIASLCPIPNPSQIGFSVELTAALLVKDKLNAFGLMEPYAIDKERSVRAYGIYPRASFFNHDCLPNACRFDYVDSTVGPGNTDMIIRVIHDLPQGREICLSYFPVNVNYSDRQRRLKEDYGFVCECDRCRVEANWSDEEGEGEGEGEDDDMEDDEAAMDEDDEFENEHMGMMGDAGSAENLDAGKADNDFPHAYFFIRYMCNKDNCGGTLAPLPPSHTRSRALMECNVCGTLSKCDELADGNAL